MSDFLKLTITGPDGTVAAGQVRAKMRDLRSEYLPGVMKGVGEFLRRVMLARQFKSEGAYLGSQWAPLGARYIAWKQKHGYPTTIGQRTGALKRALEGDPQPFSMSGYAYPSDEPTTISAQPVLEWDANHVTVGADVFEDGAEYSMKFNDFKARSIFGGGKMPHDVEFGVGKILSLAVAASTRIGEMPPDIATETIDSAARQWIDVQALREVMR